MKLGNVAKVLMGQSPKGDSYNNTGEGIPLLNGPTEFGPSHPVPALWTTQPTKLCKSGDLLFCVRGSTGRMNWADQTYCLGRGVAGIHAKSESSIDTKFIYYQVINRLPALLAIATGSVFPNLGSKNFASFEIDWPDPKQREDITSILGALDDKIELSRRMNETLEAIAQALFKDWFVNFGPVRAKAEGQAPYLTPEIWELFPDALDDEDKPVGWELDSLRSFTNIKNGYAFKRKDWRGKGVPVVKIGSVKPGFVDLSQASFVHEYLVKERENFQLDVGDMLVGLTGYVGETGRIPPTNVRPMLNQRVGKFEPFASLDSYVFVCVRDPSFKEFAESKAHGSAQANVSTRSLLAFPVVNPGQPLSKTFCEITSPLFSKSLANQGESSILAQTRDLLLPKLMSGEIRLRDAEKAVEAVV